MTQPVVFVWKELDVCVEGGVVERVKAMVPIQRYVRVAAKQFEEGAEYPLEVLQLRNMAFHNFYMAAVEEAYSNLPESLAPSFPSSTHLRRWALIQLGHFLQREITYETEEDANRCARWIRADDTYSRIRVQKAEDGWMVIVRTAKSQELSSMAKAEFEQTARDVLELLETKINVPKGSLMKNAGRSA